MVQSPQIMKPHSVLYQTEDTLSFRESLLNKLEQAEARVQALEAQVKIQKYSYCVCFIDLSNHCDALPFFNWLQLEENSKLWGRQKQDLLTTLNEYRHGFVRTSASILHNEPLVSWTAAALFMSPKLWRCVQLFFLKCSAPNVFCFLQKPVCVKKRTTGGGRSKRNDLQMSCWTLNASDKVFSCNKCI